MEECTSRWYMRGLHLRLICTAKHLHTRPNQHIYTPAVIHKSHSLQQHTATKMQITMNKSMMARAPRRAAVVCRAEIKPARVAGAAMASVAAAALLSSSTMAIGLPGFSPSALQERSDRTFQEVNSSTSKTGNSDPANQMRPDLQKGTFSPSQETKEAGKQGLKTVANKIGSAAESAVDKVTPGTSSIGETGAVKNFLDNNSQRADAVGEEAAAKSKQVFNSLGLNKNSS